MNDTLALRINGDQTTFEPGEELAGTVSWNFPERPRAVEVRLFWFTRGKGTEDATVVATVLFDNPVPAEERPFRFRLPESPYSFSGKLISLVWAIELLAKPSKELARVEFTMAPGGQEIELQEVPRKERKKRFFSWTPA